MALLNLVKALKEIDTADLDHLEKLMTLSGVVQAQQQGINEASNQAGVSS